MLKRIAILTLIALAMFLAGTCLIHSPSGEPAAQSFEPFTKTFSLPASATKQIIPMCSTGSTNCIPDFKQVSHSVTLTMNFATACGFLLDASSNNSNFNTISAGSSSAGFISGNIYTVTAQANGYYPYLRIVELPCTTPVTITYTGYSTTQSIAYGGYPLIWTVTSYLATGYGFLTPTVLQGVTCSNSDTTNTAWLWVTANLFTRVPASDFQLIFASIGPSGNYNYFGPPITLPGISQNSLINSLYLRATTDATGATPVTNPVYCSVQINGSGPYYPFFPPSP